MVGREGGTRTLMASKPLVFETNVSTITPPSHTYKLE